MSFGGRLFALQPGLKLPESDGIGLPLMGQYRQFLRQRPALGGKQPANDKVGEIRILYQHRTGKMGSQDFTDLIIRRLFAAKGWPCLLYTSRCV